MPKRYPNPLLRDQDTELLTKIAEEHGFFGASETEWSKFVTHIEKTYLKNDFPITDYDPPDSLGVDEMPRFYGRDGIHSAHLYLLICYQLALSADENTRNEYKIKFNDFCWREIGRIENTTDFGDWTAAIRGSIFYYLYYLITVFSASKDSKDSQKLIRAYTKYCEIVSEAHKFKLWPQSQQKNAIPYYKPIEGIVNAALALTKYTDLVTASHPKVIKAFTQAIGFALDDEPCLIIGETGTGKELIARAIHAFSNRRDNNFRAVSCAGFTPTIFNAEIQGVLQGFATDVTATRLGVFLDACGREQGTIRYGYYVDKSNKKNELIRFLPYGQKIAISTIPEKSDLKKVGGTVFLDEINSLDLPIQAALLRIIQESEVLVQGETQPRRFYVKLICAGNEEITDLIAKGRFREDLYYRIDKGSIKVPALRELKSCFEEIVTSRIDKIRGKIGFENKVKISKDAMKKIKEYDWPGNMRQLENVLYRSLKQMQVNNSNTLNALYIEELTTKPKIEQKRVYDGIQYRQLIKEYLQYIYSKAGGNQTLAAEIAGIKRLELRGKIIQYGILNPKKRTRSVKKEKENGQIERSEVAETANGDKVE